MASFVKILSGSISLFSITKLIYVVDNCDMEYPRANVNLLAKELFIPMESMVTPPGINLIIFPIRVLYINLSLFNIILGICFKFINIPSIQYL